MTIEKFSGMGAYHRKSSGEIQDALCYGKNERFCVISLADGVSTCKEAKIGAEIACREITQMLLKSGEYFFEFEDKQIAESICSHILYELQKRAEKDLNSAEDYSSTAASVLYDKKNKRILCINLGDSIIMAAGKDKCSVIVTPSPSRNGCCVTTTKGAASMVSVKTLDSSGLESVMICSDGAWKHMLCEGYAFDKNKLKPEVAALILNKEYSGLKEFLIKQNCYDDYSFISLNSISENGRISA